MMCNVLNHGMTDSSLCTLYFTVDLTTMYHVFLAAHVEENGFNLSVELIVLLTSHLATLVAKTYSETPSVIHCFYITNENALKPLMLLASDVQQRSCYAYDVLLFI